MSSTAQSFTGLRGAVSLVNRPKVPFCNPNYFASTAYGTRMTPNVCVLQHSVKRKLKWLENLESLKITICHVFVWHHTNTWCLCVVNLFKILSKSIQNSFFEGAVCSSRSLTLKIAIRKSCFVVTK